MAKVSHRIILSIITSWLILFNVDLIQAQCLVKANFHDWMETGTAPSHWSVEYDSVVVQTPESINALPSFFISDREFYNVKITFTLQVQFVGDNDFVGFVFGYNSPLGTAPPGPYDFYLLDWKKATESGSPFYLLAWEGFTLCHFKNANIPQNEIVKYFWGHNYYGSDSKMELLGQLTGDALGWWTSTDYHFELDYTKNHITILKDDEILFEEQGCFTPGRVGFYTFSEYNLKIRDFEYEPFMDFTLEQDSVCSGDPVSCILEDPDCPGVTTMLDSWKWDWGDGSTSTDTNASHVYNIPGTYDISLISEFPGACMDTLVKEVTVSQPEIDFETLPQNICALDTFTCNTWLSTCPASTLQALQTTWAWGNGDTTYALVPSYAYDTPGTYQVTATSEFPGGYISSVTHDITIQSGPDVSIGNDTTVAYYSSLELTADNGPDATYTWSTGDSTSSVIIENIDKDTTISVWVTKNGCSSYDEIFIHTVKPPEFHIWMPNAFSPDNDGLNDVFLPVLEFPRINSYQMFVFNRWGQIVFNTKDYQEGWDGKYGGNPCPPGVYVYRIIYDAQNDQNQIESHEMKGIVTLLKN